MKAVLNSVCATEYSTSNRVTATEDVSGINDPIKIVLPVFKPKNECNVIKII